MPEANEVNPPVQQLTRKDAAGSATEYRNRERTTEKQPAKKSGVVLRQARLNLNGL